MIPATGRERDVRTAQKGYLPRHDKVRSLQRRLYRSAKADYRRVFHQLFEHVSRTDVLERAWVEVRNNGGAAGADGQSIKQFGERQEEYLRELALELREDTYRPRPVRRVLIPKPNGESRPLGIPSVRDRVVQTALKLVAEPVFEARFYEHSYGFRPKRSAHDALNMATRFINAGYRHVLDVDIRRYFDSVPHAQLLRSVRRQTSDTRILRLMKRIVKSPIQEPNGEIVRSRCGVPQGGPLSPLLANVYLSAVDFWFLKHTRYKDMVWIRFADDAVLVSRKPIGKLRERLDWLLSQMGLELHPDKTRMVDFGQVGATVDFLGYRVARRRRRDGQGTALLKYPAPRAQKAIRARIRKVVPVRGGRPSGLVIRELNAVISGWMQYFFLSNRRVPMTSLERFVGDRVRTYLRRNRGMRSRATRVYNDQWLRESLGLLSPYRHYVALRWPQQPHAGGGVIMGKPSA